MPCPFRHVSELDQKEPGIDREPAFSAAAEESTAEAAVPAPKELRELAAVPAPRLKATPGEPGRTHVVPETAYEEIAEELGVPFVPDEVPLDVPRFEPPPGLGELVTGEAVRRLVSVYLPADAGERVAQAMLELAEEAVAGGTAELANNARGGVGFVEILGPVVVSSAIMDMLRRLLPTQREALRRMLTMPKTVTARPTITTRPPPVTAGPAQSGVSKPFVSGGQPRLFADERFKGLLKGPPRKFAQADPEL